jgi:hypothetical protein
VEPRDDDAVPNAAPLGTYWLPSPEWDGPGGGADRKGRRGRDAMVICSATTTAAAVLLAVMGRLT